MNEISHIGNLNKQNNLSDADVLRLVYEFRTQIADLGEKYAGAINNAISDMRQVVEKDPNTSMDDLKRDFASVIDAIQSGTLLTDADLFPRQPGSTRETVSNCEVVPTDPAMIKTADVIDIFRARKFKKD